MHGIPCADHRHISERHKQAQQVDTMVTHTHTMYVHLMSEGLVPKNGPCSFRTVLSEEISFPVVSYSNNTGENISTYPQRTSYADMEVALLSWQYFGQRYDSNVTLSSLSMQVQKCTISTAELVCTFNKDEMMYVEINDKRKIVMCADYTWVGFVDAVVVAINEACSELKIRAAAKVVHSHLPASETSIDGIQFIHLYGGDKIRFSDKIVTILSASSMLLSGVVIPAGADNVNCFYVVKNTTSKYSTVIDDIIVFPK